MMEKNCPCCDKHCPVENLSCGEGRQYFRRENDEHPEERMIVLLRKCGHFLHHNMSAEATKLTKALSADERATLERLLEKCLNHWQSLPMQERPAHMGGHGPHRG